MVPPLRTCRDTCRVPAVDDAHAGTVAAASLTTEGGGRWWRHRVWRSDVRSCRPPHPRLPVWLRPLVRRPGEVQFGVLPDGPVVTGITGAEVELLARLDGALPLASTERVAAEAGIAPARWRALLALTTDLGLLTDRLPPVRGSGPEGRDASSSTAAVRWPPASRTRWCRRARPSCTVAPPGQGRGVTAATTTRPRGPRRVTGGRSAPWTAVAATRGAASARGPGRAANRRRPPRRRLPRRTLPVVPGAPPRRPRRRLAGRDEPGRTRSHPRTNGSTRGPARRAEPRPVAPRRGHRDAPRDGRPRGPPVPAGRLGRGQPPWPRMDHRRWPPHPLCPEHPARTASTGVPGSPASACHSLDGSLQRGGVSCSRMAGVPTVADHPPIVARARSPRPVREVAHHQHDHDRGQHAGQEHLVT